MQSQHLSYPFRIYNRIMGIEVPLNLGLLPDSRWAVIMLDCAYKELKTNDERLVSGKSLLPQIC